MSHVSILQVHISPIGRIQTKGEPWGTRHGNESLLLEHTTQQKMEAIEGREFQSCWKKRLLIMTVSQNSSYCEPLNYGSTPYTNHTEQTVSKGSSTCQIHLLSLKLYSWQTAKEVNILKQKQYLKAPADTPTCTALAINRRTARDASRILQVLMACSDPALCGSWDTQHQGSPVTFLPSEAPVEVRPMLTRALVL